jgi:hypothetical protein
MNMTRTGFCLPALLVLLAGLGIFACNSLPKAGSNADARVVGGLSLDFPEGFLGQDNRSIRSNILLHVRNLSTGKRFLRVVTGGRFSFPAAGGEELLLARYEYSLAGPSFSCYLNDEIGISFRPEPGEVLDLGQLAIRYTGPERSDRVTFARSTTVEDGELAAGEKGFTLRRLLETYWRYQRTLVR